ncbi:helix-turn-helix domain-containing protein [Sorangium sp. KYC3313]|uniref:helix-turn-helix domain-containing protein n=1 Tax=Sorangium sp. KYC3313 TaxID=3449740 RepID=UPI003F8CBA4D
MLASPVNFQRTRGAVLLSQLGLDQAEIARRCGVSQSAVSHWTTGRAIPRDGQKMRLRDAYRIPIAAWFEPATGDPSRPSRAA